MLSTGRVAAVVAAIAFAVSCSQRADVRKLRFLENGRRYYDNGDYSHAIIEWKNAAEIANKDPEPFYWLGLGYLGAGNIPSAVDAFRRAVAVNPNHAGAQLRMAELLTLSNDPEVLQDAIKRLRIVLNTATSATALNAIALTELKLGHEDGSESYLEDALNRFPQSLSSYVILARMRVLKKDPAGAEDVLKRAVAAAPNSADARIALGNFYLASNRSQEAGKLLRQALDLDKKGGFPLFNLAMFEYRTGRKAEAEVHFRQLAKSSDPTLKPMHAIYLFKEGDKSGAIAELQGIVRDNPKNHDLRSRLVAAYWTTNRLDLVENLLDNAVKDNAQDMDALLERAELYIASGRYPEAQNDLEKLVQLRPESGVVHYVLANLAKARGDDTGFRKELNESLRLNPELVQARIALGDQDASLRIANEEIRRSRIPEAIAQYREILLTDKNNIHALNNLAYLLTNLNQPDEAWAYAQQAKELAPTLPQVDDTLGWVLYHKGLYGQAVSYLEAAAKRSSDAAIWYHLGLAYCKTGRSDRGAPLLRAALKAAPDMPEADLAKQQLR